MYFFRREIERFAPSFSRVTLTNVDLSSIPSEIWKPYHHTKVNFEKLFLNYE